MKANPVAGQTHAPTATAETHLRVPLRPALQRKCTCGGASGRTGECEECSNRRAGLQRHPNKNTLPNEQRNVPAMVHEVIGSNGEPLDAATRLEMEKRFGHDFGRVRVHHDARAATSAEMVYAEAYTVGQHIAFATNRYQPANESGRRLLAHE